MKKKDKRVALSKDVIEGMKSIKYLSWEDIFKSKIEGIRREEFKFVKITRYLDGVLSALWNSVNYFLLYYFLAEYIEKGNSLRG